MTIIDLGNTQSGNRTELLLSNLISVVQQLGQGLQVVAMNQGALASAIETSAMFTSVNVHDALGHHESYEDAVRYVHEAGKKFRETAEAIDAELGEQTNNESEVAQGKRPV